MRKVLIVAVLTGLFSGNIQAKPSEYACKTYKKKIEQINERMRKGYKEQSGNSLRKQRRKYKELLRECR